MHVWQRQQQQQQAVAAAFNQGITWAPEDSCTTQFICLLLFISAPDNVGDGAFVDSPGANRSLKGLKLYRNQRMQLCKTAIPV